MMMMMMRENGFSSPRHETFPAGLRVLVVDDDPTWLKILEKMLKKCSYEVTTCGLARDALNLLRERKDGYDIVISDVNMPDMDGFKLLEHVGLEMDLPVIMMSVDGETSRVMKGVQHGACDYLLKPIRMKELRNIWQHVVRKKINEGRDNEIFEGIESIQMTRNGSDLTDDNHLFYGEEISSVKKRKDVEKHDEKDLAESSATKKARVVWSIDLHQKFVKAVNLIGFDKVGPKKILDLMNVPWLTRENVASHLQKYRLYLIRLQKENDQKSFVSGTSNFDSASRETAGSSSTQTSVNMRESHEASKANYGFSTNDLVVRNMDFASRETYQNAIRRRALTVEIPNPHYSRNLQIEFAHILTSSESAALEESFATRYSWHEIPHIQPKQEPDPLIDPLPLPTTVKADIGCSDKVEPLCDQLSSNVVDHHHHSSAGIANEPVLFNKPSLETEGLSLDCVGNNTAPFVSLNEDLTSCLVQSDVYLELQNIEFSEYFDAGLIADPLRFDYENFYDSSEYSVLDQGLFTA